MVYFSIFVMYSVSFWFGGFLVAEERAEAGDVITVSMFAWKPLLHMQKNFSPSPLQVFFAILMGTFFLGQAGTNYQLLVDASQVMAAFLRILNRVNGVAV